MVYYYYYYYYKARTDRIRAERALKRIHSIETKIAYNGTKARCRYIFNIAKRSTWQNYVSTINSRTSQHKMWKKVQKISGKFSPAPCQILKNPDGTYVHGKLDVANRVWQNRMLVFLMVVITLGSFFDIR